MLQYHCISEITHSNLLGNEGFWWGEQKGLKCLDKLYKHKHKNNLNWGKAPSRPFRWGRTPFFLNFTFLY